eukprot:359579-Chlamydomonas_euryale.AAC.2
MTIQLLWTELLCPVNCETSQRQAHLVGWRNRPLCNRGRLYLGFPLAGPYQGAGFSLALGFPLAGLLQCAGFPPALGSPWLDGTRLPTVADRPFSKQIRQEENAAVGKFDPTNFPSDQRRRLLGCACNIPLSVPATDTTAIVHRIWPLRV